MIKHHTVPYINLGAQWQDDRDKLLPILDKVLSSGQYVGGDEVDKFEKSIAKLCRVKYAIALNSGTDALILSLRLLGIGLVMRSLQCPTPSSLQLQQLFI